MWDHDPFGMKEFLGNLSLTLDTIRQFSLMDVPHWFQLQGVKSGAVQLRIKVISGDNLEVSTVHISFAY